MPNMCEFAIKASGPAADLERFKTAVLQDTKPSCSG
jgi:hypothetical protein